MEQTGVLNSVQRALRLVNDIEESNKKEGLSLLKHILGQKDEQLVALGYDQVIFKELIKLAQFESDIFLQDTLALLQDYYFHEAKNQDELMETLVYRFARSTDIEVCDCCLKSISSLVDCFDDAIAKHSKQLIKLADLNTITCLSPKLSEILLKIKLKLPQRKVIPNSS